MDATASEAPDEPPRGGIALRPLLALAAPALAITAGKLALSSDLAAAYPASAVLLFTWLCADSLCLGLMARDSRRRPAPRAVAGALATAACVVALGLPANLRETLLAMPPLPLAMALTLGLYLGWSALVARARFRAARAENGHGWTAAAETIVPPALLRFARTEIALLRLALFRWRAEPEVPAGSTGYAYHRHLAPMMITLLVLQFIEIGVVHLLVGLWSARAALILFALSMAGLVYLVGLIKSLRLMPVLLGGTGLRVRAGLLIDQHIACAQIAEIATSFDRETIDARTTLNAALLAWPNVLLRLREPIVRPGLLRTRRIEAVAFRLDDPAPFLAALRERFDGQPIQ
ncbi:hypothetical protein B2G71_21080 [Novosphingobium sp. PC22D]|uniref:hypothetical protein n=1 Tax=Novosphingobium sp. PC22D TaxID=1962403 RepID=UPI000BEFCE0D|nr:hypothetical protein [Novosphingobium sp. PC22D]PEQ10679.1 hypothetical protein B2G71_21080 [Novosphingobium sp. PC22D]